MVAKVIGDVVSPQSGLTVNAGKLEKAFKALQGIMEIAKTQKIKELQKSEVSLADTSIGADAKAGARVLAKDENAGAASGEKASLIVSAVSGEEMLDAIVNKSKGNEPEVSGPASVSTTAIAFAKGCITSNLSGGTGDAKAAAVAGGIALRSLVEGGKLAANSSNDGKAVQAAGITAVNKLLGAVEDIIKKTVKNVIDKVKTEVDQARVSKVSVSEAKSK
nr:variable large family protein [Borrelia coriaceae]